MPSIATLSLCLALYFCCSLSGLVQSAPLDKRGATSHPVKRLFSGVGTFYQVGTGSCGESDTNNEMVVAINKSQMENGSNPNNNPHCNQMVYIEGSAGSTTARVVDTCPGCVSGNLDMSPAVFEKVCGGTNKGVCTIRWRFA